MAIRSAYLPAILACCLATSSLCPAQAQSAEAKLVRVASFDHQVTGVTVSEDGRIFVNFPRWTEDAPISVAEVRQDGSADALPRRRMERVAQCQEGRDLARGPLRLRAERRRRRARQSLGARSGGAGDRADRPGRPKLVQIDLATNRSSAGDRFDESVAPQGSYLNDVRFSPDGRHAYITDSGRAARSSSSTSRAGTARRVLDGHPSTQFEKGVVVTTDGKPLRRPDGAAPEFAADGIALSPTASSLYWQALTGKTLYRIADRRARQQPAAEALAGKVEKVGDHRAADGLLDRRAGPAVPHRPRGKRRQARSRRRPVGALVQDARLRWPDTFAEGPDGSLYVTSSHIQDLPWFHETAGPPRTSRSGKSGGLDPGAVSVRACFSSASALEASALEGSPRC